MKLEEGQWIVVILVRLYAGIYCGIPGYPREKSVPDTEQYPKYPTPGCIQSKNTVGPSKIQHTCPYGQPDLLL